MKKRNTLLVAALAGFCLSCGLPHEPSSAEKKSVTHTPADFVRSDKLRQMDPEVEASELEQLVSGHSDFAFDLYHHLVADNDNLFFSPYSVSWALAMAYAGAAGDTAAQMEQTLQFRLPAQRFHPAMNSLDLAMASRGEETDGSGFRLNIANASWGQDGYSFLQSYLDTLAVNYGSGMFLLDFRNETEDSRHTINQWVSDRTAGKIDELLQQGDITPMTALVLTNAIYFKAAWAKPFALEITRDGEFFPLNGSAVTVPMMTTPQETFGFVEQEGYQAVELPYEGEALSMLVILPNVDRFSQVEAGLSGTMIEHVVSSLQPTELAVTMPRWQTKFRTELGGVLQQMGMVDAFGDADFSGITGSRDLRISLVIHEATVTVDEEGTEATAATAVVMSYGVPQRMVVERPFIYVIRDNETGAIIFAGRVMNPGV